MRDRCGKAASGRDLGGQAVTLGPNVRLLIVHLVAVVGLSYAQVVELLAGLYQLHVSDGEIASVMAKQHQAWLPAYEQLKADVRASPIRHYDQTPWEIQAADNAGYAWVMSAANSPAAVFCLATSRGGRHAQELHGDGRAIFVTDGYGAYRNLPGRQQLCWAHLYRVTRDLRYNGQVPENQQPYVTAWYEAFANIYENLRFTLRQPYDRGRRWRQREEFWARVQTLASEPVPEAGEPAKLTRLKKQLLQAKGRRLFTCLTHNTPGRQQPGGTRPATTGVEPETEFRE